MNPTALKQLQMVVYMAGACILLPAGAAFAQPTPAPGMPPAMMSKDSQNMKMDQHSTAMHKSMMSGMDGMKKLPMSGDVDRDFAVMMRAHHQQGVDMAETQLMHGKSAEMKAMAKNIIKEQKKEIAKFDQWLAKQTTR